MDRDDDRPVVVVTGAARGGGRGAALALADSAAHVLLVGRSTAAQPNRLLPGTLEEVCAEVRARGVDAHWLRADLARPEDCARVVDAVHDRFGRCDVLVNNAAFNPIGPFLDTGIRRWRAAMDVNAGAAAALVSGLAPGMVARGEGRIINIGSLAAVAEVGVDQLGYASSKAALERFTVGLAEELRNTGVAVNLIRVDEGLRSEALTTMLPDHVIDPARSYSTEEFGAAVAWLARQPTSFSGNLLGFADLRRLGGIVGHTTAGTGSSTRDGGAITAFVTIEARPGRAGELLDLLTRMAAVAASDDGTEAWDVHRDGADADRFVVYERYRDRDAWRRHRANGPLGALGAQLDELAGSVDIVGARLLAGTSPAIATTRGAT